MWVLPKTWTRAGNGFWVCRRVEQSKEIVPGDVDGVLQCLIIDLSGEMEVRTVYSYIVYIIQCTSGHEYSLTIQLSFLHA